MQEIALIIEPNYFMNCVGLIKFLDVYFKHTGVLML